MPPPKHVVVVGGGFAGLACAVDLAAAGARVTVIEARRALGGRAGSFEDDASGDPVDNGQHLFMACYTATRAFLEAIGRAHLVRFQRDFTVDYLEPGRRTRLRCPPLPAPWHLLAGILSLKGLTLADRAALGAALPALARLRRPADAAALEGLTVTAWLDRLGQSPGLRRRIWHPLAIAVLNESPDRAPASLLARVLVEGFASDRRLSGLGFATVGLGDLYTEASRRILEARGGVVRTGARVAAIAEEAGRVTGVGLADGSTVEADAVVSTVPPRDLARIGVPLPGIESFESSPILSVNLWIDRPLPSVADFDFAAMIHGETQWVFNKERMTGGRARHLAAVISAARDQVSRSNDDLAALVWDEIRACLPGSREAGVVRWMVVRERTATFAATVQAEPLRPGPISPLPGLLLAGDWTARGLPATIEAAVRSGQRCAAIVTARDAATR